MEFTKMHGAGNDYVYVDCTRHPLSCPEQWAKSISDRHFGVGSDGLVLILPSAVADFRMRMFNADGSEAQMCGNASRCVGKYVYDNGLTDKTEISLETKAGIKKLSLAAEAAVFLSCLILFALTKPITLLAGLSPESASMCLFMMTAITIVKPIVWTAAFIPGYGLRAAGDVRFSMILSCTSMWACRVTLAVFLIRVLGFGPIAVWIGMFEDWTIRGIAFLLRFKSGRWLLHRVTQ